MRICAAFLALLLPLRALAADLNQTIRLDRIFDGKELRKQSLFLAPTKQAVKKAAEAAAKAADSESKPPPPPFPSKLKKISWIGNLSWGLINSVLGFLLAAGLSIWHLIRYGKFPKIGMSSTGAQFQVDVKKLTGGWDLSLGIFHIGNIASNAKAKDHWGDEMNNHESAHAVQSAVLGPFYLPAVLISYASNGFQHGGFIEKSADRIGRVRRTKPPKNTPDVVQNKNNP